MSLVTKTGNSTPTVYQDDEAHAHSTELHHRLEEILKELKRQSRLLREILDHDPEHEEHIHEVEE